VEVVVGGDRVVQIDVDAGEFEHHQNKLGSREISRQLEIQRCELDKTAEIRLASSQRGGSLQQ